MRQTTAGLTHSCHCPHLAMLIHDRPMSTDAPAATADARARFRAADPGARSPPPRAGADRPSARPQQDEELRQLRRELAEQTRRDLLQPDAVADRAGRPAQGPALHLRLSVAGVRGVRRAARRPPLRRRPGHPSPASPGSTSTRCSSSAIRRAGPTRNAAPATSAVPIPRATARRSCKMKLAEKYGLPVICLIDTPGAYPGIGAEERGQSQAIAENMYEMSRLQDADHLRRHRRRGQRRGAGHRRRRPRGDARVLLLLGHQPRRLRRHPLEEPPVRRAGRHRAEVHLARTCCGWASSITSSKSRSAAPTATTTRRPCA